MNGPDHLKLDEVIKFLQGHGGWEREILSGGIGLLRAGMGESVSQALSFEFLAPVVSRFWHKMRGYGLPLCLLSAVFYLFWTSSAGLKTLHLGSCVITTNLHGIQSGFSEIRDSVVCERGTPLPLYLVTASPLFYLFLSVLQQGGHKKEAGWALLTRRICSQEVSMVHNVKVFWRGTLPTGSWHRAMGDFDV